MGARLQGARLYAELRPPRLSHAGHSEALRWLDDEVGPAVRLALFHEILADPNYAGRLFTTGQSAIKGKLYRMMFPRLVPVLRGRMSIDEESAKAAREVLCAEMPQVASEAMASWRARWIDAPAVDYARRIWAEHR